MYIVTETESHHIYLYISFLFYLIATLIIREI